MCQTGGLCIDTMYQTGGDSDVCVDTMCQTGGVCVDTVRQTGGVYRHGVSDWRCVYRHAVSDWRCVCVDMVCQTSGVCVDTMCQTGGMCVARCVRLAVRVTCVSGSLSRRINSPFLLSPTRRAIKLQNCFDIRKSSPQESLKTFPHTPCFRRFFPFFLL